MAFHTQFEIGTGHALAVVADTNQPPAAPVRQNIDAPRTRVERVLDQFLDDACRPLDHLAGGDTIDDGLG